MTPEFWAGKRVLITGHTGFKGAWASILLERVGAEVHGLSLPPEEPSLFEQAGIESLVSSSNIIDLRNEEATRRTVAETDPEVVLHFAAQSLVRRAYREPVTTFASNVLGTAHLLEALRDAKALESILITTTDKVYYNDESGAIFAEGDRLGGLEPYGASKAACEHVISAYRASYFAKRSIPVLVARAGNVIGGGDWSEDRILPDIIRSILSGTVLEVRNPKAVRPWQHVLDALCGYLRLIERKGHDVVQIGDPEAFAWNFGPAAAEEMITVEQICQWAAEAWPGRFSWAVVPDPMGIRESGLLLLDPSKAMSELDWRPRMTPGAALLSTLDWYRQVSEGARPLDVCREQIASMFEPA